MAVFPGWWVEPSLGGAGFCLLCVWSQASCARPGLSSVQSSLGRLWKGFFALATGLREGKSRGRGASRS